jgi:transcriptional antiterminator
MFINDNHFDGWMEKLYRAIREVGKDMKSLIHADTVFDKDDKPMDNQDLCQLLHVSPRTLQRYRSDGLLPFHKRGQKIYYKLSDVRDFVYKNGDPWDKREFENAAKAKDGE